MKELKFIMKSKKINITELAEKTGLSTVALSNVINEKSSPNLDNVIKIANALRVTVGELLGEKEIHINNEYICPHCGMPMVVKVKKE
ncbi:helix-turn-helix domain-containing protein [Bacteroides pyogenes]|jgi:transcriptional regulator with XRE-family HTH domain|uniref:Helix-turn-helix transcriptional regulator n=1 Tax=Bacteroides pyogenes TaxID=310300 RepID=A0A5D3EBC8_9BACE|nr:helix-turn-helix transcriptional regulator [Bacteroides pyogenes]TYK32850.1 helix-turn-helix transcriptional regulator [Bacteroides pyogenes]